MVCPAHYLCSVARFTVLLIIHVLWYTRSYLSVFCFNFCCLADVRKGGFGATVIFDLVRMFVL